ncbi:putative serine/threonine-protein kinase PBL22 [Bidens hawaiensis]|uniref:putative serine/threonine-protein kinase PBL22 n=1 Tax=Bidens hawaiensis TaxID=980011 RepID=UPI00404A4E8D
MIFDTGNGKESELSTSSMQPSQSCRHFEFQEILLATENFADSLIIGSGGFGKVYKGNIIHGSSLVVAAIKRLDSMSNQGASEFWAEVEILSMLRHCNLVSLIGYCYYEKELILVYEYMPNGTLDIHLHKLGTPLSWLQRLNICIGASRGLHYLHTGTGIQSGVIHRDVKSSNILLHESWAAKISDFGLSKIGPTNQPSTYVNTLIKGTFGYLDPNYFTTGKLTRKSDVYAFGVVLLEVLCRKRAVDKSLDDEEWGLVTWVQDSIKEGKLKRIIDPDIRSEISPKSLKKFVKIAERCLHNSPKQRPTMAEVVVSLESVLVLQEKFKNSLQVAGKTFLNRMVNMLPFTPDGQNSVQSDSNLSSNSNGNNGIAHFQNPSPSLKVFKFGDLEKATRKFSPDFLLGEGGFGKVFLGWVEQNTLAPSKQDVGTPVAVKRLKQISSQGPAEWLAEVNFLGHMDHPNIIRLLGHCKDESEHLLVYEYMPNRSFDRFLFTDIAKQLSWGTRLLIMIGVANGLTYLHSKNSCAVV